MLIKKVLFVSEHCKFWMVEVWSAPASEWTDIWEVQQFDLNWDNPGKYAVESAEVQSLSHCYSSSWSCHSIIVQNWIQVWSSYHIYQFGQFYGLSMLVVDIAQWESVLVVGGQQFAQIGNYYTIWKNLLLLISPSNRKKCRVIPEFA